MYICVQSTGYKCDKACAFLSNVQTVDMHYLFSLLIDEVFISMSDVIKYLYNTI